MAVDAIIVYGADGSVETFNHSAEEMFGFQAAEIVGKQVTALLPDLRAGDNSFRPSEKPSGGGATA